MRKKPQPVPPLAERQRPGLSATLPFPRSLDTCQSCGLLADPDDGIALTRYREFDEWDRPTRTLVILCRPCAARLVDPHARIYARIPTHEPVPGAIALCDGCRFAGPLECRHPAAKANGGPGVLLTVAKPTFVHLNYGGGRGEFTNLWPWSPPSRCKQREPLEPVESTE